MKPLSYYNYSTTTIFFIFVAQQFSLLFFVTTGFSTSSIATFTPRLFNNAISFNLPPFLSEQQHHGIRNTNYNNAYIIVATTKNIRSKRILRMTSNSSDNYNDNDKIDKLSPRKLVQLGMIYFQKGDVQTSIELFDKAERMDKSLTPYLWQRGISYYYADRFQEGSDQFRNDVQVNPLDVEEIVWDIACQYRMNRGGRELALNKLSLPKGKTDRRKIMGTVYSLFRGDGATEQDLVQAGHSGSVSDEFYSLFYLALWCEAIGEAMKAENYMRAAVNSAYVKGYNDYMISVAKVHCQSRGWSY